MYRTLLSPVGFFIVDNSGQSTVFWILTQDMKRGLCKESLYHGQQQKSYN